MVKGARAPLPGVEPLLPARYAPQRTAAEHTWTEAQQSPDSSGGETRFPRMESPLGPSPVKPSFPTDVPEIRVEVSAREENPAPKEFVPARQLPRERRLPSSAVETSLETQENSLRRVSDRRETAAAVLPRRETAAASEPALAPPRMASNPRKASSSEAAADASSSQSRQTEHNPASAAASQMGPVNRHDHQDSPSLRRQDRRAGVVESGEGTISDVTISIGHLEIRAEQPAPRAHKPAFRPRVSLNDFLNQRNRERV
jgi:hypothetical protein